MIKQRKWHASQLDGEKWCVYTETQQLVCHANGRDEAQFIAQAPAMYEAIKLMLESAADGRQVPEWVCERMVSMRSIQSAIKGEIE